ncbi:MAG: hypothetical protein ACI4TK_05745, partial [Agathobacter sp.]
MIFKIGHVDLTKAKLIPAYDLQTNGLFIAFRTPGIPWCRFALNDMVVVVYRVTYEVHLYSPHNKEARFVFNCTPNEHEY